MIIIIIAMVMAITRTMAVMGTIEITNFLQSCTIPGERQSRLLGQDKEILPQQTSQMHRVLPSQSLPSRLDQKQIARHGNHDQQSSTLLHNPEADDAGRQ